MGIRKTTAGSGGGGGDIGGSIAATQVAFGSGSNTIEGSNNFTYDGNVLLLNPLNVAGKGLVIGTGSTNGDYQFVNFTAAATVSDNDSVIFGNDGSPLGIGRAFSSIWFYQPSNDDFALSFFGGSTFNPSGVGSAPIGAQVWIDTLGLTGSQTGTILEASNLYIGAAPTLGTVNNYSLHCLGASNFDDFVIINSTATGKPTLSIAAASGQSANLFEAHINDTTLVTYIDNQGNLNITPNGVSGKPGIVLNAVASIFGSGITSGDEANLFYFSGTTQHWVSGTIAQQRFFIVDQPNISVSASQVTNSANVWVATPTTSTAHLFAYSALQVGSNANAVSHANVNYQALSVLAHTITLSGSTTLSGAVQSGLNINQITFASTTSPFTVTSAASLLITKPPTGTASDPVVTLTNAYIARLGNISTEVDNTDVLIAPTGAARAALTLQGHSSQSVDIFDVTDSSNLIYFRVEENGTVLCGNNVTVPTGVQYSFLQTASSIITWATGGTPANQYGCVNFGSTTLASVDANQSFNNASNVFVGSVNTGTNVTISNFAANLQVGAVNGGTATSSLIYSANLQFVGLYGASQLISITGGSNSQTLGQIQAGIYIDQLEFEAAHTTTIDIACALFIGNVAQGTNVTITSPYAIYSGSSNPSLFTGQLASQANAITLGSAVTVIALISNVGIITGNGSGNTVATMTGGISGMVATLVFVDAHVTITNNGASPGTNQFDLSASFSSVLHKTLTVVYNGTYWIEVARSANT